MNDDDLALLDVVNAAVDAVSVPKGYRWQLDQNGQMLTLYRTRTHQRVGSVLTQTVNEMWRWKAADPKGYYTHGAFGREPTLEAAVRRLRTVVLALGWPRGGAT